MVPSVARHIACAALCVWSLAYAGAQEAVRLIVSKAVTYNVLQHTLPIKFNISAQTASVVDIAFCGSSPQATTTVLLLVKAGAQARITPPVVTMDDCKNSAAQVAVRLRSVVTDPAVIAIASINWQNWSVEIVSQSASVINGGATESSLTAALNSRITIADFSTRSMSSTLANGSAVTLDGQIAFLGGNMYLGLVPAPASAELPSAYLTDGHLSDPENLHVRLPIALFNSLSQTQFGLKPFPLDPSAPGTLALVAPAISVMGTVLHTTATLHHQTAGDFNLDIAWSGQDLALSNVGITARLLTCQPGDQACETQNSLRQQLASAYSKNFTSRYQGDLLRPTDFSHGIDLTVFGVPLHLKVQGIRTDISGQEIEFANIAAVASQ